MKAPRTIFPRQKRVSQKHTTEDIKTISSKLITEKIETIDSADEKKLLKLSTSLTQFKNKVFKVETIKLIPVTNQSHTLNTINKSEFRQTTKTKFDDNLLNVLNSIKYEDDDFVDVES